MKRTIDLSSDRWHALDLLAMQVGSVNTRGTRHGEVSVTALLRDMADGKIVTMKREDQEKLADAIRFGALP